jgi:hypothetical protein
MTTTTQRFVYRQRSAESVEQVLRLHKRDRVWDKAVRLAYHGEPARLCALARAAPRLHKSKIDDLVGLIERGKFSSRDAPPLDKRTELKQRILAIVHKREERLRTRHGGRLRYGARPRLIARAMGELSEELNELDHRSHDDDTVRDNRAVLAAEIRVDLERGEKPRRWLNPRREA